MPNKKEPLSLITVKTLLTVVIFTGLGTIIIGGGYLVGEYGKNKNATDNKIVKPVVRDKLRVCNIDSDCYEYNPCGRGISCFNKTGYEISVRNHVNISCPAVEIMPWQSYRYDKEKCVCSEGICAKVFSKEKYCKSLEYSLKWCGKNKPSEYPYNPEDSECFKIEDLFNENCISEKNIENETADWRIYRNEEFGFEVRYPEDWKEINKTPAIMSFTRKDNENNLIQIRSMDRENGISLIEQIKGYGSVEPELIKINNRGFYFLKISMVGLVFYEYCIENKNKIFIISMLNMSSDLPMNAQDESDIEYPTDEKLSEELNILRIIVSSFKFIEN